MTFALQALIQQASTELGSEACREGRHNWKSIGGRGCPHDDGDNGHCGQAVYECATCGATDHGERGGPGYSDCASTPRCDYRGKFKQLVAEWKAPGGLLDGSFI